METTTNQAVTTTAATSNSSGTGNRPQKAVFTVAVYGKDSAGKERKKWVRIGAGWINRDKSLNLVLDALPTNGRIQVRDADEAPRQNGVPGPEPERPEPPQGTDKIPF